MGRQSLASYIIDTSSESFLVSGLSMKRALRPGSLVECPICHEVGLFSVLKCVKHLPRDCVQCFRAITGFMMTSLSFFSFFPPFFCAPPMRKDPWPEIFVLLRTKPMAGCDESFLRLSCVFAFFFFFFFFFPLSLFLVSSYHLFPLL